MLRLATTISDIRSLTAVLLLCAGVLLHGCSDNGDSAQDQIRAFIEAGVEAAEARRSGDLGDMIHGGYLDQKGYNKKQLGGLLRAYFFRHKNIHLFTKIDEIELLGDNQALVRLHVAMAGSAISDIDAISSLRARLYRFELRLVREDEWRLQHASWQPASIVDLE